MYLRNSPFTHADKIEAPLLLIHGSDDQNPGTHVFQTERLYGALQGLGKPVRMVLLPCERHAYDALESVMHVVAEQDIFLTKHVLKEKTELPSEERIKRAKI
jgi:dipeptidyl aminopeptidase/acylaminoacyl peptidase